MSPGQLFDTSLEGDVLVLIPRRDLSRLYEDNLDVEINEILEMASAGGVRHVVIDFGKVGYFGSSMLGGMLALWKQVRGRDGQMAVVNVAAACGEILGAAHLDDIWPRCDSLAGAIARVRADADGTVESTRD